MKLGFRFFIGNLILQFLSVIETERETRNQIEFYRECVKGLLYQTKETKEINMQLALAYRVRTQLDKIDKLKEKLITTKLKNSFVKFVSGKRFLRSGFNPTTKIMLRRI